MKLLIITHSYYPANTPRAFRWKAVTEALLQQGHEIDLVCAREPGTPALETLDGVRIHRVGGNLWRRLKLQTVPQTASEIPNGPTNRPSFKQVLLRTAKKLHSLTWKQIYWPDYACGWYYPAKAKALALLATRGHDAMISVSHPFTGHMVGLALKKVFPKVRWIVDIGDPFCFLDETPVNNQRLYKALNFRSEAQVFALADALAVTTEPTKDKYAELFPECGVKINVIPPLLSIPEVAILPEKNNNAQGIIKLVYTGTLYSGIRSPNFLLHLYSKLLETPLSERLELHFFGRMDGCKEDFEPYKPLLGSKLFIHGLVSRESVSQALRNSDVLINIENGTHYQLPSKIVEYIQTGKPIINIFRSKSDSSLSILERYTPVINILNNGENVSFTQLNELVDFIESPPFSSETEVKNLAEEFSVARVARSYVDLLKGGST